ncbi:MAG: flagellar motor protein MotA [Acetobacter sp.]|jgi:hypothetical protein
MTRPTTCLIRMAVFLAFILLLAAALWRPLFSAFLNNPGLDSFILLVLLTGIGWNFLLVVRLIPEVKWADQARQSRNSLLQADPPKMLSGIAAAITPRSEHARSTLSTSAMQALLDSLAGRLSEGREVSRYLTGLLIFLGLLGTFWGLLLTVASVADVISGMSVGNGDINIMFDQLKAGLAKPLHGMGTAFSGSLFGLASALIVGFLDLSAGQAQNRFFNELEEWLGSLTRFSSSMSDGDGNVPAYVQALLEQTAENLEGLQVLLRAGETQRQQQVELLSRLDDHIGALAGMKNDQEELRLMRGHMQTIEQLLTRLVTEGERERQQATADIRSDLRLLARTIAASSGQQAG